MARRSIHTQAELRELIIAASTQLIESKGLSGLSAREIARTIDYSPGTIYNVFKNLDDVILTIELRLLERLANELGDVEAKGGQSGSRVLIIAAQYVRFSHENPKLWSLLFQNRLADGKEVPTQYQERLDDLVDVIETALADEVDGLGPEELRRSARALWASLHGVTLLSTANRLSNVSLETAPDLVNNLMVTYLDGLRSRALQA